MLTYMNMVRSQCNQYVCVCSWSLFGSYFGILLFGIVSVAVM